MTPGEHGGAGKVIDSIRADADRPMRVAKGLPLWDTRLRYVLRWARRGDDPPTPHQWKTADGRSRCVRCGWAEVVEAIEAAGLVLSVCDRKECREAVEAEVM